MKMAVFYQLIYRIYHIHIFANKALTFNQHFIIVKLPCGIEKIAHVVLLKLHRLTHHFPLDGVQKSGAEYA